MLNFVSKLFGSSSQRMLKKYSSTIDKINDLENLAKKYRRELFEKLLIIKQGHPGSIFSMMDIVVALYHGGFVRFDRKKNQFLDKVLILLNLEIFVL